MERVENFQNDDHVVCNHRDGKRQFGIDVQYDTLCIESVYPDSSAFEALRSHIGSRIVAVDGEAVHDFLRLQTLCFKASSNRRSAVTLRLRRAPFAVATWRVAQPPRPSPDKTVWHAHHGQGIVMKEAASGGHVLVQFKNHRHWVPRRELRPVAAPAALPILSSTAPAPLRPPLSALIVALQRLSRETGARPISFGALRRMAARLPLDPDCLPTVLRQAKKDGLVDFPCIDLVLGRDDTVPISLVLGNVVAPPPHSPAPPPLPKCRWWSVAGDGYFPILTDPKAGLHGHHLLILGGRKSSAWPSSDVFQFDLRSGARSKLQCTWPCWSPNKRPPEDWQGYTAAFIPDAVLMLGPSPTVWQLDLSVSPALWSEYLTEGPPSAVRSDAVAVPYQGAVLLVGGTQPRGVPVYCPDLLRLEPHTWEWHTVPTQGIPPTGRVGHTAVLSADEQHLVVVGGRQMADGNNRPASDRVIALHLPSMRWFPINVAGTPIPALVNHSAAVTRRNELLLCGRLPHRAARMFLLSLNSSVCTEIMTETPPLNLTGTHVAAMDGNTFIRFGGDDTTQVHFCHVAMPSTVQSTSFALVNLRRSRARHPNHLPPELVHHVMVWLGAAPRPFCPFCPLAH